MKKIISTDKAPAAIGPYSQAIEVNGIDVLKGADDVVKEFVNEDAKFVKEFVKEDVKFTKEFVKAQRLIYKLISDQPQVSAAMMANKIGVSSRQVQKYLKRLTDLQLIIREGGRKNGFWKIIDNDYEDFFKRI